MSPLKKFLDQHHLLTQADLAAKISKAAGWSVTQPQVSRWCTLRAVPSTANRIAIAKATRGEVPVGAWQSVLREQSGRARRPSGHDGAVAQ